MLICLLKALFCSVLLVTNANAAPVPSDSSDQCSTIVVRKEIRQLSDGERIAFIDAISKLKESGEYEKFAPIHNDYTPFAHITPGFFPWHRYYTRLFESALQNINPSIVMPYWDWTIDSQAPEESEIFKWLGGNGRGPLQCVLDGPLANWRSNIPNDHCLQRQFNGGDKILAIYSSESINNMIDTIDTYDKFQDTIESGPHAALHRGVGGDLGVLVSPNDPLFFLHHAFVDYIWYQWQKNHPQLARAYTGTNRVGGKPSQECDMLPPFNVPVDLQFDTTSKGYCYVYSPTPSFNSTKFKSSKTDLLDLDTLKLSIGNPPEYFRAFGGPNPNDRQNGQKIRIPYSIPSEYIQMHQGSEEKVREHEIANAKFIQNLNQLDSYSSPSSLDKRAETIRQLVEMGKNIPTPFDNPDLPKPDLALPNPARSRCSK